MLIDREVLLKIFEKPDRDQQAIFDAYQIDLNALGPIIVRHAKDIDIPNLKKSVENNEDEELLLHLVTQAVAYIELGLRIANEFELRGGKFVDTKRQNM